SYELNERTLSQVTVYSLFSFQGIQDAPANWLGLFYCADKSVNREWLYPSRSSPPSLSNTCSFTLFAYYVTMNG
ncbi:hypothetical protein, partial [Laceyella putida]|uniref:hypothetical protein n=1 Tax=Laceyella putida TaxID=110101 RepID=UPI0036D32ACE